MKKYPNTKDSGLDWIGEIPKHWGVFPIKRIGKIITGNTPSTKKESNYGNDFPWANPEDLNSEIYIKKTKKMLSIDGSNQSRKIPPKSIMVSCIGNIGKSCISKIEMATNQQINSIICENDVPEFIYFQIKTNSHTLSKFANKTVLSILNKNDFGNFKIVKPELIEEQKQITKFLMKKNNFANSELTKNKKMIELLKEKKQVLINNIISKGLNPSTSMKCTEMEGMENIPEHWEVIPFKFLLTQKMDNGIFKKKDQYGKGNPLVNVGDLYQKDGIVNQNMLERVIVEKNELVKFSVTPNDIFFVRSSLKLEGIGVSSIIKNIQEPTVFECHIIRTRSNTQKIEPMYLKYLLNSIKFREYLISISQTVTMTTISQDHIKNLKIFVPSKLEQKEIVNYIQIQNERIENLILKLETQIRKIQESQQSLLASVITGKIDVRGVIA
jgi:type I restriction enzyme, S subunit